MIVKRTLIVLLFSLASAGAVAQVPSVDLFLFDVTGRTSIRTLDDATLALISGALDRDAHRVFEAQRMNGHSGLASVRREVAAIAVQGFQTASPRSLLIARKQTLAGEGKDGTWFLPVGKATILSELRWDPKASTGKLRLSEDTVRMARLPDGVEICTSVSGTLAGSEKAHCGRIALDPKTIPTSGLIPVPISKGVMPFVDDNARLAWGFLVKKVAKTFSEPSKTIVQLESTDIAVVVLADKHLRNPAAMLYKISLKSSPQ